MLLLKQHTQTKNKKIYKKHTKAKAKAKAQKLYYRNQMLNQGVAWSQARGRLKPTKG